VEALRTYFDSLMDAIRLSTWIVQEQMAFRQIDEYAAYIKGELYLHGGFVLYVAESVMMAEIFSETAEEMNWLIETPSRFAISRT